MSERRPGPAGEPTPEQLAQGTRGRRRREPRYGAFIGTGVVLGLLTAVVVYLVGEPPQQYPRGTVLGYLATSLAALGALAGGLLAVLSARRLTGTAGVRRRRARGRDRRRSG